MLVRVLAPLRLNFINHLSASCRPHNNTDLNITRITPRSPAYRYLCHTELSNADSAARRDFVRTTGSSAGSTVTISGVAYPPVYCHPSDNSNGAIPVTLHVKRYYTQLADDSTADRQIFDTICKVRWIYHPTTRILL